MTTTVLPPDVEADVIAYLNGDDAVVAAHGDGAGQPNIATVMRGPFPMQQITAGGGPWTRLQQLATLTLNTWGAPGAAENDRPAVKQLHRVTLGALRNRAGLIIAGVNVSWVAVPTACQWLPDGDQGRFTSSLVFYARSV